MAKKVEIWASVIVWGFVAVGVYLIIQNRASQEPSYVAYRRPTWPQIVKNRVQVLLGADRMRFRNVSTSQVNGGSVTCGEAQPRYRWPAGYGEFEYEDGEYQRFIADRGVLMPLLEKKTDPAKFERMWAELCGR